MKQFIKKNITVVILIVGLFNNNIMIQSENQQKDTTTTINEPSIQNIIQEEIYYIIQNIENQLGFTIEKKIEIMNKLLENKNFINMVINAIQLRQFISNEYKDIEKSIYNYENVFIGSTSLLFLSNLLQKHLIKNDYFNLLSDGFKISTVISGLLFLKSRYKEQYIKKNHISSYEIIQKNIYEYAYKIIAESINNIEKINKN
jgi:hypothetical protein